MQNQIPMIKRGICPACGGTEVYAGTQITFKEGFRNSNTIPINYLSSATLNNFVCVNCGYVESYILDGKALQKIAKNWPKVGDEGNLTS